MTRLQKKCLIAAAGTHLLVVVVVLCSGFITSSPKPDDSTVLTMIPDTAIDKVFTSGVKDPQPPKPVTPVQPTEPPTPPTPPQPKTDVTPPKPVEPVKPPDDSKPVDIAQPKPKPVKPHEIKPEFEKADPNKPAVDNTAADAAKQKKERDARLKAIRDAERAIQKNSSSSTKIDMPGDSSASYASYASIVKSVYTQAWTPPDDAANDSANVKASITIANDGRVKTAHIVTPSGDAGVDSSVQKTLDRVQQLPAFPEGATDTERTYIINFNLKAKRMLG